MTSLKELQKKLKQSERLLRIKFVSLTKREKDILTRTVKLQEEVGELSNDILSILSLQRQSKLEAFNKKNVYTEFADVILSAIMLANSLGVDVERAVNDKFEKLINIYSQDR